jgi:O-antigen/teichoic acid export membrane protein
MRRAIPLATNAIVVGITSLLLVPLLVRASGAAGWASLAIGQATGSVAAAIVAYGWGAVGPARVAAADASQRAQIYREAVRVQFTLFLPVTLATCVVATIAAGGNALLASLGAASIAAGGLSSAWFVVGSGQTWLLTVTDTVPRAVGNFLAAGIVMVTSNAAAAVVATVVAPLVSAVLGVWIVGRRSHAFGRAALESERRTIRSILVSERHAAAMSWSGTLYASAPLVLAGLLRIDGLPVFALIDKVSKQALVALSPIMNALQGWVPEGRGAEALWTRIRRALVTCVVFGVLTMAGFGFFGQWLMEILAGGKISVSLSAALATGALVSFSFAEFVVARGCLVALRQTALAATWLTAGTVVGLALLCLLGVTGGAIPAAWGLVAGQVLKVALILALLERARQRGLPLSAADPRVAPVGIREPTREIDQ